MCNALEEIKKEGIKEGKKEGLKEARRETIINMSAFGMSVDDISNCLNINKTEVKRILSEIKKV